MKPLSLPAPLRILLVNRPAMLSNLSALAAARGLSLVLNLVAMVIAARWLGDRAFGIYQFGVMTGNLFALFAGFGLSLVVTREVAYDPRAGSQRYRQALRLQWGLVLAGYAILSGYALTLEPGWREAVLVGGLVLAPWPFTQIVLARLNGYERLVLSAATDACGALVLTTALVTLVGQGFGPLGLLGAWALKEASSLALALYLERTRLEPIARDAVARLGSLLRAAAPFGLMVFLSFLYLRLGLLFVQRLAPEDVGHYAAAVRVTEAFIMVAGLLGTALYPRLARLKGRPRELAATLELSHRMAAMLGLPAAAVLATAGRPLMRLLLGPDFLPAGSVLSVLAVQVGIFYLYWPSAHALNATGNERRWNVVVGAMLAAAAACNYWLVPSFGALGAAATMGLAETVAMLGVFHQIRRAVPEARLGRALRPLLVPGLALSASAFGLGRINLAAGLGLGLVVYTLLVWPLLRSVLAVTSREDHV